MNKEKIAKQVLEIIKQEYFGSRDEQKASKKNPHFVEQLKNLTEASILVGDAPQVVEGHVEGNYTAEGGIKNDSGETIRSATINCDFQSVTSLYEVSPSSFSEFRLADVAKKAVDYKKEVVIKYDDRQKVAAQCGAYKSTDEFDKYNFKFFKGRLRDWKFVETGDRVALPICEVGFRHLDEDGKNQSRLLGAVEFDNDCNITSHNFKYKTPISKKGKKTRNLIVGLIVAALIIAVGAVVLPMLL